jgi:hypothetical protein
VIAGANPAALNTQARKTNRNALNQFRLRIFQPGLLTRPGPASHPTTLSLLPSLLIMKIILLTIARFSGNRAARCLV